MVPRTRTAQHPALPRRKYRQRGGRRVEAIRATNFLALTTSSLAVSRKKRIVLTDDEGQPSLLLNANSFVRDLLVLGDDVSPRDYCHRPVILARPSDALDMALGILTMRREQDAAHGETVILLWSPSTKRMITGSDVLRCLLSGMGEHKEFAA